MGNYKGPKNVSIDTPDGHNAQRIQSQEWERLFGTTMWDPDGPQPGPGRDSGLINADLFRFIVLIGLVIFFVHFQWHMI